MWRLPRWLCPHRDAHQAVAAKASYQKRRQLRNVIPTRPISMPRVPPRTERIMPSVQQLLAFYQLEMCTFRAPLKRYLSNKLLNKTLAQSGCRKVPTAKVNLRKYVFVAKHAAIGVDIDHGPVHLKKRDHFRDIGFDH
jgi:hypothetical protein